MVKKAILIFIILGGLHFNGHLIWGTDIHYVIDSTTIMMRTGPSIENKIVRMLHSGEALEVLETEGDWSYVRLINGENPLEGWVMSQYLVDREPWEIQAKVFRKENSHLKETLSQLEYDLDQITQEKETVANSLKQTAKSLEQLQIDYEALKTGASGYLEIKEEYEILKKRHTDREKKIENLSHENDMLRTSQQYKWLGVGGIIMLFGLLIGVVIGSYRKREKGSLLY